MTVTDLPKHPTGTTKTVTTPTLHLVTCNQTAGGQVLESVTLSDITNRQLHRLLTRTFGGTITHTDPHTCTVRLPDRTQILIPATPDDRPVPVPVLRAVARTLHHDLPWLYRQLAGPDPTVTPKPKLVAVPRHATQQDAARTARQIAQDVMWIYRQLTTVRYGHGAAELFDQIAATPALAEVRRLRSLTAHTA